MAIPPLSCDVAVIGSGPAGASAARVSAAAGLKTVILEKAQIPRYKTCGGGVLGRAVRMLGESVLPVTERACFTAEFTISQKLHFTCSRNEPLVCMTMRDRFDEWLTANAVEAGAELRCGWAVQQISDADDAIRISTTKGIVTARYAVIADGAAGLSAKHAGWPDHRKMIPALECEVTVTPGELQRFGRSARFDFDIIPKGYAWVFPKKSRLSIGVLTLDPAFVNLNEAFDRYLIHLGLAPPHSIQRHGYVIPVGIRDKTFSRGRALITGDAAGFADQVTAEGISNAILSGQLAGHSIAAHFAAPGRVGEAYDAAVDEHILNDLRWANRLAKVLYGHPALRDRLFKWQGPALVRAMVEIIAGRTTYAKLLTDPSNYLRMFAGRPADSALTPAPVLQPRVNFQR